MALKKKSRWARRLLAGVAALGACGLGNSAFGQETAPAGATRFFSNKTTFHLPIEIENSYRAQISSLQLWVKEGPGAMWNMRDKAAPMQTSYTFTAPREGEYWFRIVAIDNKNQAHPSNLLIDPQDTVIVTVDSTPPVVEVFNRGAAPEGLIIQCDIRDANADLLKSTFHFQTQDGGWHAAHPLADQPSVFCIPAQANLTNSVRVLAYDLAGNTVTRTLNLAELPAAPKNVARPAPLPASPPPTLAGQPATPIVAQQQAPAVPQDTLQAPPVSDVVARPLPTIVEPSLPREVEAQTPQPLNPAPRAKTPLPQIINGPSIDPPPPMRTADPAPMTVPAPAIAPAATAPAATPPAATAPVVAQAAPPAPLTAPLSAPAPDIETVSGTLSRQPLPANLQVVGSQHVYLDYKIENVGASGVGRMEIYATRDQGRSWHKVAEDSQRKNPAEVILPGEGVFGLKLVVANGRGFGAQPPQPGDPSDWWVEVDRTQPTVTITGIGPGTGADQGSVLIFWRAEDKNLAPDAVEVSYAASREGPWVPIANNQKSTGQIRWAPPADAGGHAYIRVATRDKAGNYGLSETKEPVPLDDQSRPRVRVTGVTASAMLSSQSNSINRIQPVETSNTPIEAQRSRLQPAGHTTSTMGVEVR